MKKREQGGGSGVTEVLAELLAGRGCWTADMSWPDHNSRKNLEVTGLGWKRVTVIRDTSSIFDLSGVSV